MADGAAAQKDPGAKLPRTGLRISLYAQVIAAIVLGVAVGYLWPDFAQSLRWLGDGFIKLVRMIVAPVIFLTIVTGIGGLSVGGAMGRVAIKTFAYFLVVSTFALIVGLIVANLVQPGVGMHIDPKTLDPSAVDQYVRKSHESTVVGFLLDIIPTTLLAALTGGEILPVLFIAVLFGSGLTLVGDHGKPLLHLLESLSSVVFRIVDMLMHLAPIGAFGAMAFTVGRYGLNTLRNLAELVATFYLTSALFVVIVLGIIARMNGFSIFALLRYLKTELFLVLGTSSSEVALPRLIARMRDAGCPPAIVGLVVPTGYSFNLDGTNIYMTLAALFIAQATDVPLSLGDQLLLLSIAMLSSKGAAGVTGAGFITLAATLSIVPSVPVAGMAIILGIDRFMSECRALTNFIGNAVATIVISRWEGRLDPSKIEFTAKFRPGD
ncbi:MAG: C4-dicarboxylate transporter DctA [Steroidobacteraceae bacterium]